MMDHSDDIGLGTITFIAVILVTSIVVQGTQDTVEAKNPETNETTYSVLTDDPRLTSIANASLPDSSVENRASTTVEPWNINGFYFYNPANSNNDYKPGPIFHPTSSSGANPNEARPSTITQTVELPSIETNRHIRAVLVADNGIQTDDNEECYDSLIELGVQSNDSNKELNNYTVVGSSTKRVTLDVTSMEGENVSLVARAGKGDDGCGLWRREYTRIKALFIVLL